MDYTDRIISAIAAVMHLPPVDKCAEPTEADGMRLDEPCAAMGCPHTAMDDGEYCERCEGWVRSGEDYRD